MKSNTDSQKKNGKQIAAKQADAEWVLRLYVAGQTFRAIEAFINLKAICEDQLKGKYEIEVIDLLVNPQLGRDDQILAVPTLVRKLPVPCEKLLVIFLIQSAC